MRFHHLLPALAVASIAVSIPATSASADAATLGPRPFYLVDQMKDSSLKDRLAACAKDFEAGKTVNTTFFSIAHRGAPLQFPEHTMEGYKAAARMGAGIVECDVTFTKDKQLVCRHSQADLHTTTNILGTGLASKCTTPFTPASNGGKAKAKCLTTDITLAEFKTLKGKMDAANNKATTVEDYMNGTQRWRTDLYGISAGTLITHTESIALFKQLGVKFTPELKSPSVAMPYDGMTQEMYAQKMIDEYKAAGVPASDVWAQSFNLDDILYWIKHEPDFGKQAVYLDGRYGDGIDIMNKETFKPSMKELQEMGVNYIAPPLWMLVTAENGKIVPSVYAKEAKAAGLKIITWSLERSGPLNEGGDWYYKSISDVVDNDGAIYELLDVLANDVGVSNVFSDWPATTSFFANCMNLK